MTYCTQIKDTCQLYAKEGRRRVGEVNKKKKDCGW